MPKFIKILILYAKILLEQHIFHFTLILEIILLDSKIPCGGIFNWIAVIKKSGKWKGEDEGDVRRVVPF